MRKFIVTVNGTEYEVEVEEVTDGAVSSRPVAPVQKPAAPAAAAPAKKAVAAAGSTAVNAPMPGNVLKMQVSVGAQVKKGQILCILEAMKMENEILAPCDGTVATVAVKQGEAVQSGDLLVAIAG